MTYKFLRVDKNVGLLSLGFGVLFFVVGAAQQYVTPWFQQLGQVETGYNVLLLVYLFFALGSVVSAAFVNFLGEKRSLLIVSGFYLLFCLAIAAGNAILCYFVAITFGIAAALLWTSQTMYLNKVGNDSTRAANAGVFWTAYPLGNGLGAIVFGYLVTYISYPKAFVLYTFLGLGAVWIFSRLLDLKKNEVVSGPRRFLLPAMSRTCLMCAAIAFAQRGIYGLIVSRVPLEVESAMGRAHVGFMCAPFFILPMFLSKWATAFLDTQGRFKMAALGFAFSLSSLAVFAYAHNGWTLSAAILIASLGAIVLNPIITVLPGDISEGTALARVSGLFSVAGSCGTLFGIAAAKSGHGKSAYVVVGASILACCIPFFWTLRRGTEQLRRRVNSELAPQR